MWKWVLALVVVALAGGVLYVSMAQGAEPSGADGSQPVPLDELLRSAPEPAAELGQQDPAAAIQSFCSAEWLDDRSMQEWCVRTQTESFNRVARVFDATPLDAETRGMVDRCIVQWTAGRESIDWSVLDWCISKQFEALRAPGQ